MPESNYDDEKTLADYLIVHAGSFLSEFEKRCLRLAMLREKGYGKTSSTQFVRRIWEKESNHEIEAALASGWIELKRQIARRLLQEYGEERLLVARCPRCCRVLRSPLAQQCFWCGHDWHENRHRNSADQNKSH